MQKLNTIDADTLLSTPLPATRFIVESLLPEGLHLLAGSPKIGKCCFWMDGNRWAPYLAVFYSRKKIHCNSLLLQVVLAHPPHRLSFSEARPLMLFSRRI